jgi:hypothetical protein
MGDFDTWSNSIHNKLASILTWLIKDIQSQNAQKIKNLCHSGESDKMKI